jgi:broad specificity phosphatase PhoE
MPEFTPANVPGDRCAALVLRHAERPEFSGDDAGNDIALTDAGSTAARKLGETLGNRILSIHSSPVRRCVQTALAIADGAALSLPIKQSELLGDPGAFVLDGERAMTNWHRLGNLGVIRHLATSNVVLPGMRPAEEAVRLLRDWISTQLNGVHGLHLFITHDAVLAPLAARLTGSFVEDLHYPGFLGGMAIWHDDDDWVVSIMGHPAQPLTLLES